MQTRLTKQLAQKLRKAHRSMSFRKAARFYGILTPSGRPNGGMAKRIIQGYQPKHEDTLRRCGLIPDPKAFQVPEDEPTRRVLTGAWKIGSSWASPEEFFGARS